MIFQNKAIKVLKNSQTQTNETGTRKTLTSDEVAVYNSTHIGHVLKINTYFDVNSNYGAVSFRWQLRIQPNQSQPPPLPDTYYWNNSTESWTTTAVVNLQEIEEDPDKWQEFSYDLGSFPTTDLLVLDLYEPYVQNSGGLNALYYDNITLEFDRKDGDKREPFYGKIDDFEYKRIRTTGSNLTGSLKLSDLRLSHNNYGNILSSTTKVARPRDENTNFCYHNRKNYNTTSYKRLQKKSCKI